MDAFGIESRLNLGENRNLGEDRVSTGIDGLDTLLSGGYPKGSVVLVSGSPGTGKTIVCFQYIHTGILKGEKCLYLTSDEPVQNLVNEAAKFGFNFQNAMDAGQLKFLYLDPDNNDVHKEMEEEIKNGSYDRIIVDSLSPLSETPLWMVNNGNEIVPSANSMSTISYPIESIQATRLHLRRLMSILKETPSTVLVTSEIPEGSRSLSRDSISEFIADGIILLDLDTTMDRRKLTIRKMRKTRHTLKPQEIEITESGIKLR